MCSVENAMFARKRPSQGKYLGRESRDVLSAIKSERVLRWSRYRRRYLREPLISIRVYISRQFDSVAQRWLQVTLSSKSTGRTVYHYLKPAMFYNRGFSVLGSEATLGAAHCDASGIRGLCSLSARETWIFRDQANAGDQNLWKM